MEPRITWLSLTVVSCSLGETMRLDSWVVDTPTHPSWRNQGGCVVGSLSDQSYFTTLNLCTLSYCVEYHKVLTTDMWAVTENLVPVSARHTAWAIQPIRVCLWTQRFFHFEPWSWRSASQWGQAFWSQLLFLSPAQNFLAGKNKVDCLPEDDAHSLHFIIFHLPPVSLCCVAWSWSFLL